MPTHQKTPEAHYNSIVDSLSKLHAGSKAPHEQLCKTSNTDLDKTILPEMLYPLAKWGLITLAHRGVTALTDWAYISNHPSSNQSGGR